MATGIKRVLVTGGAGFIGSHLVDRLVKAGHQVTIIDDMTGGSIGNLPDDVLIYKYDCRGEHMMDKIMQERKPEVVFHLAANAAENKAQFSPVDITSRNFDAFIKVLKASIKGGAMKRFVFTSSIAVYGSEPLSGYREVKRNTRATADDVIRELEEQLLESGFRETDKPQPEDLYGISKLAAEQSLKVMSEVHDFEYVIARPHNVYGPRQNMTDPYRNVVTIWMNAIMRNEPWYIYGDGKQRRCFSYIDDVADALFKCGFENVAGETFNIGADTAYTLNDLADAIRHVSGTDSKPVYLPERPQEVKEATASHEKAKSLLGYQDTVTLQEGLQKTWEWASALGPQEPQYGELELVNNKTPKNWIK